MATAVAARKKTRYAAPRACLLYTSTSMTFDELKEKAHALPLKPGVYIICLLYTSRCV